MLLQLVNQLRVAKEIFISIFKKKSFFFVVLLVDLSMMGVNFELKLLT
jgi:hypothetical protein